MAAYGDLSIIQQNDARETERLIRKAVQLGYETIAVSSIHELTSGKGKKGKQKSSIPLPFNWKELPGLKCLVDANRKVKIYSRITVVLEDQSQLHQLRSDPFSGYDILAVTPTTEKLFQQCCSTLDVDIITIDMKSRLPFYLKLPQVGQAVERGVHFEIVYSPAIRDATQRKYVISYALEVARTSKGRNIIFSSAAESVMDLRSPYDASNLGLLFGLKEEQCKAAISKNVRAVLYHAEGRKCAAKSTIIGCHLTAVNRSELWKIGKEKDERNKIDNGHDDVDGHPKKKKLKLS